MFVSLVKEICFLIAQKKCEIDYSVSRWDLIVGEVQEGRACVTVTFFDQRARMVLILLIKRLLPRANRWGPTSDRWLETNFSLQLCLLAQLTANFVDLCRECHLAPPQLFHLFFMLTMCLRACLSRNLSQSYETLDVLYIIVVDWPKRLSWLILLLLH